MSEKKLLKIDLGCGQRKASPEHIGVDKVQITKDGVDLVDVVHDLRQIPYPFEDNSAEEIFASHFFEHLDGYERKAFIEECYRILIKPQRDEYGNVTRVGKLRLIHPFSKSDRFYQDFTHKWPPINQNTYWYFDQAWLKANGLDHGDYVGNYNFTHIIYPVPQNPQVFNLKNTETQYFMMDHYWNVVADLDVHLTAQDMPK